MGKRIFINEAQYRTIVDAMINESNFFDQADHETGFKLSGLIGKNVIFKTEAGTTGFKVDDVQAQHNGWLLRASRQDGRYLLVGNIDRLLNGKSPLPIGILYNDGQEVGKGGVMISD